MDSGRGEGWLFLVSWVASVPGTLTWWGVTSGAWLF